MILGIPKRTIIIVAVLAGIGLIYVLGANERPSDAESGGGDAGCKVRVTADILNVRAGPGTDTTIVGKFQQDAETEAEPVVQDGFRKLAEGRWAAEEFLRPVDGASCG
ncbi:SH3 domain-containing protein [Amycolatopsis aidingensis]|uniref:SH3 domain-containing protein n=1 Tax=Amycolatopsis aidingensis TaxID=2842453 RepID=UPI001C0DB67F|nr:SH3 domain-containing protein [Amycolatopsis aidingensis]